MTNTWKVVDNLNIFDKFNVMNTTKITKQDLRVKLPGFQQKTLVARDSFHELTVIFGIYGYLETLGLTNVGIHITRLSDGYTKVYTDFNDAFQDWDNQIWFQPGNCTVWTRD